MNAIVLTVVAVVDRAPEQATAYALGREIGGDNLLTVLVHDDRVGVTVSMETADPLRSLSTLRGSLAEGLARHGVTVIDWAALVALAPDEVDRRIGAASMPRLINTEMFATLCGVSRQRISELETERRAAAAEGRSYPFPPPVVPGWWIESAAKHYAANRKRKPGPAARANKSGRSDPFTAGVEKAIQATDEEFEERRRELRAKRRQSE